MSTPKILEMVRKHIYLTLLVLAALLILALGGAVAANMENTTDAYFGHRSDNTFVMDQQLKDRESERAYSSNYDESDTRGSNTYYDDEGVNSSPVHNPEPVPAPLPPPVRIIEPQPVPVVPPINVEPPYPYPIHPCGGCNPTPKKYIACPMTEQTSAYVCSL